MPPSSSTATSSSSVIGGDDAAMISSNNNNDEKNNGTARNNNADGKKSGSTIIIIGEALVILCLIALSVIVAIILRNQRTSDNNALMEEYALEVSRLKADIAISREVEVVLRSKMGGVMLELGRQSRQWETVDLGVVPTLYGIEILAEDQGDGDADNDGIQSREAKNDWLEGIRMLTVEKHLGLNELDAKLVDFGVVGGKEKIRALEED
mmetsp:Transcript_28492/g.46263  ORF Transcript_28492/g.46263 Transcript_28492/m.46263 type:complete len:209 (+) Transcript_28492:2-628(+)